MKKVCLVATAQYTVEVFLIDQLAQLSKRHDVTFFVKSDEPDFLAKRGIGARVVCIPIERKIDLLRDLQVLILLTRAFRAQSFDLVHSITPKSGLLAMLAARFAGVPIRIHTFTGQVWGSRTGVMRWLLKAADKIIVWAATHILTDSFSQREFLIRERVVSARKSGVLASGSISGVDLERFKPDASLRAAVRRQLGIPEDALVFLFMARLTRDKGALVMAEGFARFSAGGGDARLIIVGPDEERLLPRMRQLLGAARSSVHFEDYTHIPQNFMAAADIFCLPSYREGFGTVLINAAAMGIPAIASRIYGSEEAIQENVTGLLHEPGNVMELADRMRKLADDPVLRARLGENARLRAHREFSEAMVTAAVLKFYEDLMASSAVSHDANG